MRNSWLFLRFMHNFEHFTGYFCVLRQNNVGNAVVSSLHCSLSHSSSWLSSHQIILVIFYRTPSTLQIIRVILMVETTEHSSQNPPPPLLCDRDRWFACKLKALRCYSKLQNRPQKSDFSLQLVVFLSLPARLLSEPLYIQLNLLSFLLNLNIIKMIRTSKQRSRRTFLGLFSHFNF